VDDPPTRAPDCALSSARDEIAATAVQLALSFPTWVRRRKWTFTYIDDTTIRQHLSVDFRMPDAAQLPLAERHDTLLVPLWIAQKVPLTNVDVYDEDLRPLSLMSRQENGEIAARGLFRILDGLALAKANALGVPPPRVDAGTLLHALRAITAGDPAAPGHAAAVAQARATIAALGVLEDERSALLEDLAGGFMLLVPIANDPGRDRVIKLAFDTRLFWHGKGRGTRQERVNSALASLGLRDKEQVLPAIQIGWSLSTHVQVNAPAEVELGEAWLDVDQFDPATGQIVRTPRRHVVYDRPSAELNVSVRSDWDFADPAQPEDEDDPADPAVVAYRDLMNCRADVAYLQVRLAPTTRGVFVAAVVLSALTAVLLWTAEARLSGQTSAALLLAVPAALAAYLARPGEHAFAARLLVGVRLAALAVGTCSLVVAALVASGVTQSGAPPAPTALRNIRCTAANRFSGRPGGRVPRLRELTCTGALQQPARRPHATPTARAVTLYSALVATLLTVLLLCGFTRTLVADERRRNKPDAFAAHA
jgi:hypothetical protein